MDKMRRIITIFLVLLPLAVFSQTFQGNNQYVLIIENDTVKTYFLELKQAIVTNANTTGNKAYAVTTDAVLDSIVKYKSQLLLLPNTGIVNVNEIYTYDDEVCRIIQTHDRSTVNHYDPHDVPALYLFREFGCAEWKQPAGAHDAYNIGDCCTYKGSKYESVINANVWSPEIYPAGWKKL